MTLKVNNYKPSLIKVNNKFICEPIKVDGNGVVTVPQLFFKNDSFKSNSPTTKLAYLFAQIYLQDTDKIKLINDVIYQTTFCNYFDYKEALEYNIVNVEPIGSTNFLFNDNYVKSFIKIKDFIFNKNYWIIGPLINQYDKKLKYILYAYGRKGLIKKIKIKYKENE